MADFVRASRFGGLSGWTEAEIQKCISDALQAPAYVAQLALQGKTPEQACREVGAAAAGTAAETGAARQAAAFARETAGKAPLTITAHPAYRARMLLMERPTVVVSPAYEEEKPPPAADEDDDYVPPRYTTTPIGPAKKSWLSFLPSWWPYAVGGIALIGGGYYVAKKRGMLKGFKGLGRFSGMTSQQERFRNAAKACKGKPGYRQCMSRKLKRG